MWKLGHWSHMEWNIHRTGAGVDRRVEGLNTDADTYLIVMWTIASTLFLNIRNCLKHVIKAQCR